MLSRTVKSRTWDNERKPVESLNSNSILNATEYLVCFEDWREDTYKANLITIESIYSQIDDNRRRLLMMKEIICHEKPQKQYPMKTRAIQPNQAKNQNVLNVDVTCKLNGKTELILGYRLQIWRIRTQYR